jgi:hypothetical protein
LMVAVTVLALVPLVTSVWSDIITNYPKYELGQSSYKTTVVQSLHKE